MIRKTIFLFVFVLTTFSVFAQGYYADLTFDVDSSGLVKIDGVTNSPSFENLSQTQNFTSKKGEFWLLNISSSEVFDEYIYEVILPENANINYVKTTKNFRIAQEGERIKIIGLASNQNLNIQIQYTIGFSSGSFYSSGVLILAGLFIMIALIVVGLMFKVNYSNKTLLEKHESLTKKSSSGKEKIKYEILTERQKQILEIIKTGGKQTQKEIESKMHIPKSSVSRNIATLVARKYLIKEQMGQSNFISLNDDFEY